MLKNCLQLPDWRVELVTQTSELSFPSAFQRVNISPWLNRQPSRYSRFTYVSQVTPTTSECWSISPLSQTRWRYNFFFFFKIISPKMRAACNLKHLARLLGFVVTRQSQTVALPQWGNICWDDYVGRCWHRQRRCRKANGSSSRNWGFNLWRPDSFV